MEKALGRIEAALTRIENAASRAPKTDEDLAARHERLRTAVTQSLQQLDSLLGQRP